MVTGILVRVRNGFLAADLLKIGPKGYIHGWIFVGAPGVGLHVFHPRHGKGTISHQDAHGHVHVAFDNGKKRSFGTTPAPKGSATGLGRRKDVAGGQDEFSRRLAAAGAANRRGKYEEAANNYRHAAHATTHPKINAEMHQRADTALARIPAGQPRLPTTREFAVTDQSGSAHNLGQILTHDDSGAAKELHRLRDDLRSGKTPPEQAANELDRITATHPGTTHGHRQLSTAAAGARSNRSYGHIMAAPSKPGRVPRPADLKPERAVHVDPTPSVDVPKPSGPEPEFGEWAHPRTGEKRSYVNNWTALAGLEVNRYKTGNIRDASLDGQTISNAEASRMGANGGKVWLGADGTIHTQGLNDEADRRVRGALKDHPRTRPVVKPKPPTVIPKPASTPAASVGRPDIEFGIPQPIATPNENPSSAGLNQAHQAVRQTRDHLRFHNIANQDPGLSAAGDAYTKAYSHAEGIREQRDRLHARTLSLREGQRANPDRHDAYQAKINEAEAADTALMLPHADAIAAVRGPAKAFDDQVKALHRATGQRRAAGMPKLPIPSEGGSTDRDNATTQAEGEIAGELRRIGHVNGMDTGRADIKDAVQNYRKAAHNLDLARTHHESTRDAAATARSDHDFATAGQTRRSPVETGRHLAAAEIAHKDATERLTQANNNRNQAVQQFGEDLRTAIARQTGARSDEANRVRSAQNRADQLAAEANTAANAGDDTRRLALLREAASTTPDAQQRQLWTDHANSLETRMQQQNQPASRHAEHLAAADAALASGDRAKAINHLRVAAQHAPTPAEAQHARDRETVLAADEMGVPVPKDVARRLAGGNPTYSAPRATGTAVAAAPAVRGRDGGTAYDHVHAALSNRVQGESRAATIARGQTAAKDLTDREIQDALMHGRRYTLGGPVHANTKDSLRAEAKDRGIPTVRPKDTAAATPAAAAPAAGGKPSPYLDAATGRDTGSYADHRITAGRLQTGDVIRVAPNRAGQLASTRTGGQPATVQRIERDASGRYDIHTDQGVVSGQVSHQTFGYHQLAGHAGTGTPSAVKPEKTRAKRQPGIARVGDLVAYGNDSDGLQFHQVAAHNNGKITELHDPATGRRFAPAPGNGTALVPAEHLKTPEQAATAVAGEKFDNVDDMRAALRAHLSPDAPAARKGEDSALANRLIGGVADVADDPVVTGRAERYLQAAGDYDAAKLGTDATRLAETKARGIQALNDYMGAVHDARQRRKANAEAVRLADVNTQIHEAMAARGHRYDRARDSHHYYNEYDGRLAGSLGSTGDRPDDLLAAIHRGDYGQPRARFTPTADRPSAMTIPGSVGVPAHEWQSARSRGRAATAAPDITRSGVGHLDGHAVRAEVHDPLSNGGAYMWQIRREDTGKVVEEGHARNLSEAFGRADRIFSSQRGQGMARTPGKHTTYEVRPNPTQHAPKGHAVYERDQNGAERLVSTSLYESRAREDAAKLTAAEAARAARDAPYAPRN